MLRISDQRFQFFKKHFLYYWTEQQQQQQVVPIKTFCLDVLFRKFIMNNPLVCLSDDNWGALEERTSPPATLLELLSGQQNHDCGVKTNYSVIPVLRRPLTIQRHWEEREMDQQCINTVHSLLSWYDHLSPWATSSSIEHCWIFYRLAALRNTII